MNPMHFVRRRRLFYGISLCLIIPGILSLGFWGLRLGIDFAGGAVAELSWEKSTESIDSLQRYVAGADVSNLHIQTSGNQQFLIRYPATSQEEAKNRLTIIEKRLADKAEGIHEVSFSVVGPTVSKSLTQKAIRAIIVASIVIIFYIAWAFREVRAPASAWLFGLAAIVALLHDLLVTIGIFSILGHFLLWVEVDSLFIVSLLTVLGFSVHDTIVVFDRIRENLRLMPGVAFGDVVDASLQQTMARSLSTSLTVLLTLLALFLFGSSSVHGFVLALLIGITTGTYSSIFNASMLLVSWQGWRDRLKQRQRAAKLAASQA